MALQHQLPRRVLATALTVLALLAQPAFSKRIVPKGFGKDVLGLSASRAATPAAKVLMRARDEVGNTTQFALLQLIHGLSGEPSRCCCKSASGQSASLPALLPVCKLFKSGSLKKPNAFRGWACPGDGWHHYKRFKFTGSKLNSLRSSCVPEVDPETMSRMSTALQATFDMFDEDKQDGGLTKAELMKMLQHGEYEPVVKERVASLAMGKTMSFDEYQEMILSGFFAEFEKIDSNSDGLITAKDFFKVKPANKEQKPQIEAQFEVIGEGDDHLNYSQFVKLVAGIMEIAVLALQSQAAIMQAALSGNDVDMISALKPLLTKTCELTRLKEACDSLATLGSS